MKRYRNKCKFDSLYKSSVLLYENLIALFKSTFTTLLQNMYSNLWENNDFQFKLVYNNIE